jgi:predicted DNA-binding protein
MEHHCTCSIRMPIALHEQLDRLAEAEERYPSQVVRRLIRRAYAEMERQNPLLTWAGLQCREAGTAEGG